MKWTRDEYIEIMTFGSVNKQMFVELFGLIIGLEDEWKLQGATQDEINLLSFNFDYVPQICCGGNTDMRGCFERKIIEETSEYRIARDKLGRTTKLCKQTPTLELPQDYPVKDMDTWLKIKPFYEFHEDCINWDHVKLAKKSQQNGSLVVASIPGGFDLPRELMVEEVVCLSYYEQPELMIDILDTVANTSFKVLDRISEKIIIDNLSVHDDMAGKCGSLIGPNQINEFIKPYYRKIWDLLSSRGTKLFSQDSDGNMSSVID